jgi:hypothetical protein
MVGTFYFLFSIQFILLYIRLSRWSDTVPLVTDQFLVSLTVSVPVRLCTVNNLSHLSLLLLAKRDVPGRPILFQSVRLSGARDCNEALGGNPCKSYLCGAMTLLSS